MPPVLEPSKSRVDGLAFLGLSLSRKSEKGHPESVTHQTAFDLNKVLDRDYEYIFSTNDDGWLVGGGEPGPPRSYKLAAADSAHVEIMRIGTYESAWGGVKVEDIVEALESGVILIPEITVVPTAVVANPDTPPELEIRFDMVKDDESSSALPVNWQLRFLHNQLFRYFQFPSRFCPGAFHSTILRKAEFRSAESQKQYFEKCAQAVAAWRARGPQPLVPEESDVARKKIVTVKCKQEHINLLENIKVLEPTVSPDYQSGIWLFTDRENITHRFLPNFLPPYDTSEKLAIIHEFLKDEWDECTLSWKKAGVKSSKSCNSVAGLKDFLLKHGWSLAVAGAVGFAVGALLNKKK